MVPARERLVFVAMKVALQVEDHTCTEGSLKFSSDNQQVGGSHRHLARFDRIYIFQSAPSLAGRKLLQYSIKSDTTRSDHHPVFASLQLEDRPRKASKWKMNCAFFEEACPEITKIWREQLAEAPFFSKLRVVIRYYKHLCKRRAAETRVDEEALKADLEAATTALQDDADDPAL
jgi:hypothetical protein